MLYNIEKQYLYAKLIMEMLILKITIDVDDKNEEIEDIKKKIYTIRGKQVMLDSDVARLYKYETKNVNKAMKRNIERFPEDFCFQLTIDELNQMWFQNGTTFEKQNAKNIGVKNIYHMHTQIRT